MGYTLQNNNLIPPAIKIYRENHKVEVKLYR